MGIDITQEDLIRLNEARQLKCLPAGRNGKRISLCTIYRWASRGVGGVRLETLKVGGSHCTSLEALQRFFDAVSRNREPVVNAPTPMGGKNIHAASRRVDELLSNGQRLPAKRAVKISQAMRDPALSHMSTSARRRYLEAERRLDEAGI